MAELADTPDLGRVTTVENVVYEQYSKNKDYRFRIVQRKNDVFQVILEKRYFEWFWLDDGYEKGYYDEDAPYYVEEHNGTHLADTLEKAIEIGMEELRCFSSEI